MFRSSKSNGTTGWLGAVAGRDRPRRPRPHRRPRVELLEGRDVPGATPVVDVIGRLPAAEYDQYIRDARLWSDGSVFKDWGNEPTVAVNPVNRDEVVITTFAYGSAIQSGLGQTRASVWYSADGGVSWGIRFPFTESPVPGAGNRVPADQTVAFDDNGVLHAAMMTGTRVGDPAYKGDAFHGATAHPNWDGVDGRPETAWQWNPNRVNLPDETNNYADQSWLALQGNRVFVGYDHFNKDFGAAEERVSVSADGGATFTADNPVSSGGLMSLSANPGLRLATDRAGNVYSLFGLADRPLAFDSGKPNQLHYRLNMSSDGGLTWKFTDAGRKPGGLVVDDGWSLQFGSLFGGVNRLRGNITAVAADPTGAHVYAAYGKEDAAGVDRIYLAEFHPDPGHPGQLVGRASPIALSVPGQRAALPSVAVTDTGAVGVMYDTFNPADGQFHVHLGTSTDSGLTFADEDLYDFSPAGISYPGDRLLGDYQSLIAVGKKLYGGFGGRGNTIDPATGIDTTGMLVPLFYSLSVPDNGRTALAASAGAGGTSVTLAAALDGTGFAAAGLAPEVGPAAGAGGVVANGRATASADRGGPPERSIRRTAPHGRGRTIPAHAGSRLAAVHPSHDRAAGLRPASLTSGAAAVEGVFAV